MRLFRFNRKEDATGISGTGMVAEGVEFENGKCALSWRTDKSGLVIYDSISVAESVHGHEGSTQVEVLEMPAEIQEIFDAFFSGASKEKVKRMWTSLLAPKKPTRKRRKKAETKETKSE